MRSPSRPGRGSSKASVEADMIRRTVGIGTSLLASLLVLVTLSCKGNGTTSTPAATSGTWHITELGGNGIADSARTEVRIANDGRVSGNTGCNRFTGQAIVDG